MRSELALVLLAAGCGAEPWSIAQVELPLIPDDVTTVAVWVTDTDRQMVVASATVSPPATAVELGVPAERPLEFSVLARTVQPGPERLGGKMPGWVGRVLKRIPLGREKIVLPITAHPAGALTISPVFSPGLDRVVHARLSSETGEPPHDLLLAPGQDRVLALRTGRYRVSVAEADQDAAAIIGGEGLYVARRVESVCQVRIEPSSPVPPPEAVRTIEVALANLMGDRIAPPIATSSTAAFRVRIDAFDAAGQQAHSSADVEIDLTTVPEGLIPNGHFVASSLPAITPPLSIGSLARLSISAEATIEDRPDRSRTLRDVLRANVLAPGVEPGPPSRLALALLGGPDDLIGGARLSVELIDGRSLFAAGASGTVDFSASDPWLFLPGGPSAELTAADRGHLIREVARPSGPRGLFVVLRATFTSTAVPGTLTSSVTLPVLELSK